MPIAAVSRTYLAGNRRFVHTTCMNQLIRKAAVGVAALFPLMGCDTTGNLIQDHEKMCKANGKIVVHDRELWKAYVAGAEKAFQDRRRGFGEKTERSILEAVPEFDLRFGQKLEVNRKYPKKDIIRSDNVILNKGLPVASYVDFIAQYDSFSGPGRLTCTGLYPNLYIWSR